MHSDETPRSTAASPPKMSRCPETIRRDKSIRVLVLGPRLLCGPLASTLRCSGPPAGAGQCPLEADYGGDLDFAGRTPPGKEASAANAGKVSGAVAVAVLVLVLVCCGDDPAPVARFLASPRAAALSCGIVLICSDRAAAALQASPPGLRASLPGPLPVPVTWLLPESREEALRCAILTVSQRQNTDGLSLPLSVSVSEPQGLRQRQSCSPLTLRQEQAARLATEGFSNEEIAVRLCVTVATVKSHLQIAYRKADIHRRTQLAPLFMASRSRAVPESYPA